VARLDTLQTGDDHLPPDHLKAQVCRELDRLELLLAGEGRFSRRTGKRSRRARRPPK
jgi:hypothetical protein